MWGQWSRVWHTFSWLHPPPRPKSRKKKVHSEKQESLLVFCSYVACILCLITPKKYQNLVLQRQIQPSRGLGSLARQPAAADVQRRVQSAHRGGGVAARSETVDTRAELRPTHRSSEFFFSFLLRSALHEPIRSRRGFLDFDQISWIRPRIKQVGGYLGIYICVKSIKKKSGLSPDLDRFSLIYTEWSHYGKWQARWLLLCIRRQCGCVLKFRVRGVSCGRTTHAFGDLAPK